MLPCITDINVHVVAESDIEPDTDILVEDNE
jgi:hypothetical protein